MNFNDFVLLRLNSQRYSTINSLKLQNPQKQAILVQSVYKKWQKIYPMTAGFICFFCHQYISGLYLQAIQLMKDHSEQKTVLYHRVSRIQAD